MGSRRKILVHRTRAEFTNISRQNHGNSHSTGRNAPKPDALGDPRDGYGAPPPWLSCDRRMAALARTRSFCFRLCQNDDAPEPLPHYTAIIEKPKRRGSAIARFCMVSATQ